MCEWGTDIVLRVPIPAYLSHTGEFHWDNKGIDACIAPLVQALNDAGIYTANSCCGHGKRPGQIILHDGRVLIVAATFDEANRIIDAAFPAPETPEEADAYLREHGYDPEQMVKDIQTKLAPAFEEARKRLFGDENSQERFMKEYHVSVLKDVPGERNERHEWRTYQWGQEARMIEEMREYARAEFPTYSLTVHQFDVSETSYGEPTLMFVTAPNGRVFSPFAIYVTIDGVRL